MFDSEGVKMPGIKKLSVYRQEVNLTRDIFSIPGRSTQHVGVGISYRKIVTQTVQELLDDIPYYNPQTFLEKYIYATVLMDQTHIRNSNRNCQKNWIQKASFFLDLSAFQ